MAKPAPWEGPLTFHDELRVVGHAGAAVGTDHTAVFAHTPLGSVGHADRG